MQPQKISGNMFARELRSSGAWQTCKWRCPSWERGFLFPRQLMWALGWDGAWKSFAFIRGQGSTGEQLRDVGMAWCHCLARRQRLSVKNGKSKQPENEADPNVAVAHFGFGMREVGPMQGPALSSEPACHQMERFHPPGHGDKLETTSPKAFSSR